MACNNAQAQCTTCTPTFVPTCPAAGGLCTRLDTGYASLPYTKVMNFYMPQTLNAPSILSECSCNQVDLNSLTVTGVGGLPAGLTYVLSNGGTYNVAGGDTLGCASFCGTPLAAGLYPVTVYLSADVTAIGTPIGNVSENNVPQQYYDTLLVLPDTVPGVTSFSYGNNGFVACDSITLNLSAKLSAPQPNLTRWFWQIGNNQTSQLQSPGIYTFTNNSNVPDTIPITLSTVFYNYTVASAHVTAITGGFCGLLDQPYCYIECACISCADKPNPYVSFPALGYTAPSQSCICANVNYDNINASIPLGTYTTPVQVWAAANTELCQAVLLGNDTLNVGLGQQNWADNNTDGYVQFDTVAGTTVTETLYVIVNPNPLTPVVAPAQDTFCSGDSVLLTLDSAASYTNCSFQWYKDTVFLNSVTDSAFYTSQSGAYKVIVTNQATGCVATSQPKLVTAALVPVSPTMVQYGGTDEYLDPVPGAGFGVNWYYNGNLVAGQNGHTLPYYGSGTYQAQVYNISDTACYVTTVNDTIAGIESVKPVLNVSIMPNPNNGSFVLSFNSPQAQNLDIRLQNTLGQTVYAQPLSHFAGNYTQPISAGDLSKGIYILTIASEKGLYCTKVIVQ